MTPTLALVLLALVVGYALGAYIHRPRTDAARLIRCVQRWQFERARRDDGDSDGYAFEQVDAELRAWRPSDEQETR